MSHLNNALQLFKRIRKNRHITRAYRHKYAFAGMGSHSIGNLYPVLHYLNVPLKYIVCKTARTADAIRRHYPHVTATVHWQEALNDPETGGVFICTDPAQHFGLVKSALDANKNVFVEKPPCSSADELQQLISTCARTHCTCMAGLQKRYAPCTVTLRRKLPAAHALSYNYRFLTGAFPEGDPCRDLWIHPLDLVSYLFGEATVISTARSAHSRSEATLFLQLRHGNVIGSLELSTRYAWNQPLEAMSINTAAGVFTMENQQTLSFSPKPRTIMSLPIEKIVAHVPETQLLYSADSFLPELHNNTLVSLGYFDEISTFINLCEGHRARNLSPLEAIVPTFALLERLQQA